MFPKQLCYFCGHRWYGNTWLVWERAASTGTRGRYGNTRLVGQHGAGTGTRGRYGNARPVRMRGWCGNGTEKVGYLVLMQENLIFLESLSGDISIPANCILAHFSVLYT